MPKLINYPGVDDAIATAQQTANRYQSGVVVLYDPQGDEFLFRVLPYFRGIENSSQIVERLVKPSTAAYF